MIDSCLDNDFLHWKVGKFVKEKHDLNALKNYLRENFHIIKELRMGIIANGNELGVMNKATFRRACDLMKV